VQSEETAQCTGRWKPDYEMGRKRKLPWAAMNPFKSSGSFPHRESEAEQLSMCQWLRFIPHEDVKRSLEITGKLFRGQQCHELMYSAA